MSRSTGSTGRTGSRFDLMGQLERISDAVADEIVAKGDDLDKALGDRPFGEEKLSERQQVQRYSAYVRDNQEAWTAMIQEHGERPVVEYAKRLERLAARYPDELLPPANAPSPSLQLLSGPSDQTGSGEPGEGTEGPPEGTEGSPPPT